MPTTQQFAYFFAFIGAGLVFMVLAFSVFLPVIVIAPSKFALSFTIGSLLVMAGFAALRGLKQQASHMLSASRLPFTAGKLLTACAQAQAVKLAHCWQAVIIHSKPLNVSTCGYIQRPRCSKSDHMLASGYLTTMFGTLYAALVMHSYVMSLVCCTLQVCQCSRIDQVCLV